MKEPRPTYTSEGPYDVTDPQLLRALERIEARARRLEREREEREREPGFFVAPKHRLPPL